MDRRSILTDLRSGDFRSGDFRRLLRGLDVTPALHTLLMEAASTSDLLGDSPPGTKLAAAAKVALGTHAGHVWISKGAGAIAAGLAAVNIFGGFLVTQRMLSMYRKKDRSA